MPVSRYRPFFVKSGSVQKVSWFFNLPQDVLKTLAHRIVVGLPLEQLAVNVGSLFFQALLQIYLGQSDRGNMRRGILVSFGLFVLFVHGKCERGGHDRRRFAGNDPGFGLQERVLGGGGGCGITDFGTHSARIRGARGRTIEEHQAAMGRLFARFAAVAAQNPKADRRHGFSAEEIATVSEKNPYIGFPYTKLMNANAFIDQAAAIILTSVAKARELAIPEHRWVYLHGCADAYDHWFISDRKNYHSSPAMRTVAREALEMAETSLAEIDALDLYSCFPSAVEIACAEMGIAEDDPRGLTITGGLPYFGGPGNNYVTHSIAEMMDRVRAKPGSKGMVTANGNYVTKQSAGIYSTEPTKRPFAPKDPAVYQAEIDADKGPSTTEAPEGVATIETYTVMHDRKGPAYAILFGRLGDGRRFIANTPEDPALLEDMTRRDYLGAGGRVTTTDGLAVFTPD